MIMVSQVDCRLEGCGFETPYANHWIYIYMLSCLVTNRFLMYMWLETFIKEALDGQYVIAGKFKSMFSICDRRTAGRKNPTSGHLRTQKHEQRLTVCRERFLRTVT